MQDIYIHRGLHILALISCYISSSVLVISSKCRPQRSFDSPSIQASYREESAPLVGCVTDRRGLLQQVHVINYLSTPGVTHANVLVNIDPSPERTSTRTLVVVLNSNISVAWEVELLSPADLDVSLFRFIISNSSSLEIASLSSGRYEVVSDGTLPDGDRDLLTSVTRDIGNVTSFSSVHDVDEVALYTKSNNGATSVCDLSSSRSAVSAYALEDQSIQGCFMDSYDLPNQRQIHVIELFSAKKYLDYDSPEPVEVVVQKGEDFAEGRRDTLLVLVAQSPTLWKVRSAGIEGSLLILSNTGVEAQGARFTETRLQVSSNILATKTGLLDWAESEYGTVMSYSNIRVANQITVYLQGPFPERTENVTSTRNTELSLGSVVTCSTSTLKVTVPIELVVKHGITPTMVTWSSRDCFGIMTDQGLVLEAGIRNCSSVFSPNPGGTFTISNEVIFYSGDVSEGSGLNPYNNDDEDGSAPTVLDRKSVSCQFQVKDGTLPTRQISAGPLGTDVSMYLDVYTDGEFRQRIPKEPFPAKIKDPLFFEMGVTNDDRLNIIISDCWIGIPGLARYVDRIGDLTQDGCPTEPSFKYLPLTYPSFKMPPVPGTVKQFTFDLPYIDEMVMTFYVYCNLSLCTHSPIEFAERIIPCSQLSQEGPQCEPRQGIQLWPMKNIKIGPFKIQSRVDLHYNLTGLTSQNCSANHDGVLIPGYVFAVVVVLAFIIGVILVSSIWIITKFTRVPPPPAETSTDDSPVANGHIPNGNVPNREPPHEMQPFLQVGAVDPSRIPHEGLYNGLDPEV